MVSQKQLKEWKEQHGEILHVPFSDGKECYLIPPSRKVLGLAYAKGAKDPLGSAEVIVKNCWLGGDEEIKTDKGYLIGLSDVATELSELVEVEITQQGNDFAFKFLDGKFCTIKAPNRNQASLAMIAGRRDPLSMVESILQSCWVEGNTEIKTETGYLLSLVQEVDKILEVKTAQVKKI